MNGSLQSQLKKLKEENFYLNQFIRKEKQKKANLKNKKAVFKIEINSEKKLNEKLMQINNTTNTNSTLDNPQNEENRRVLNQQRRSSLENKKKNLATSSFFNPTQIKKNDQKFKKNSFYTSSVSHPTSPLSSSPPSSSPSSPLSSSPVEVSTQIQFISDSIQNIQKSHQNSPKKRSSLRKKRCQSLPVTQHSNLKPLKTHTDNQQDHFYNPLQEAWVYAKIGENSVFKRFYCAIFSNEYLYFYSNENFSLLEHEFPISSFTHCEELKKDNGIKLTLQNDVLFINFPSKDLCKIWFNLINDLI